MGLAGAAKTIIFTSNAPDQDPNPGYNTCYTVNSVHSGSKHSVQGEKITSQKGRLQCNPDS